ncbi:MAG: hypothetical protein AAF492_14320 [Verrucomicrobiota bacterium]
MRLSARETILGWLTLVALLLGVSYYFGEPMYKQWREGEGVRQDLERRKTLALAKISKKDQVQKKIERLQTIMPKYPKKTDIRSQFLKTVQRNADKFDLTILRQEPQDEEETGELYSLTVNCSWEGELEAIVRFLYALQIEGAMIDFKQLTITPSRTSPDRLKGNCIIDFAYSRVDEVDT